VNAQWRFFLAVRRAEIELIRDLRRYKGATLHTRLHRLDPLLAEAEAIGRGEGFRAREFVPVIKVQLAQALADGEPERAVELAHEVHARGWPLSRAGAAVVALLEPTSQRKQAPAALRAAIDAIQADERDPGWKKAGAETAAGWRRARARQLGG
jgi:hypothetical protein